MTALVDRLAEHGIRPGSFAVGSQKLPCPACSKDRRNAKDPCLSLKIDDRGATWNCHHCDWQDGFVIHDREYRAQPVRREPVRITTEPKPLPAHAIAYFATREIGEAALAFAGVGWSDSRSSVVFPFRKPGSSDIVNAKFRRLPKDGFSQIKDGEKLYWLLDKLDAEASRDLYIVEGEIDALSLIEAGIPNVLSVPDGAPAKAVDPATSTRKFSFIDACDTWIEPFDRIIIATDADDPGENLANELARRYGKDRCWRVSWPNATKDANDFVGRDPAKIAAWPIAADAPFSVAYRDAQGATVSVTGARLDVTSRPARVLPIGGPFWSFARSDQAYTVTVEAGYATADDMPGNFRRAMLVLIGAYDADREGGDIFAAAEMRAKSLCRSYRRATL